MKRKGKTVKDVYKNTDNGDPHPEAMWVEKWQSSILSKFLTADRNTACNCPPSTLSSPLSVTLSFPQAHTCQQLHQFIRFWVLRLDSERRGYRRPLRFSIDLLTIVGANKESVLDSSLPSTSSKISTLESTVVLSPDHCSPVMHEAGSLWSTRVYVNVLGMQTGSYDWIKWVWGLKNPDPYITKYSYKI